MPKLSLKNQVHSDARDARSRRVLEINLDLALILIFSAATLVITLLPFFDGSALRAVFGFVFALFIPGYVFIAALFPRKSDLTVAERLAFSVGLSIALVPVAGAILNSTPGGIRLVPMTILLLLFTGITDMIAIWRRLRTPARERFFWHLEDRFAEVRRAKLVPTKRADQAVAMILIGSIVVSAAVVTYVVLFPKQEAGFTEFYLLGSNGTIGGYPTQFRAGQPQTIVVNVNNQEHRDTTYDLVVVLRNNSTSSILYQESVMVPQSQTWQKTINLTPDFTGTDLKLDFLLYTSGAHAVPYRENYLLVNVTGPAV